MCVSIIMAFVAFTMVVSVFLQLQLHDCYCQLTPAFDLSLTLSRTSIIHWYQMLRARIC